jgi:hypothetical protein
MAVSGDNLGRYLPLQLAADGVMIRWVSQFLSEQWPVLAAKEKAAPLGAGGTGQDVQPDFWTGCDPLITAVMEAHCAEAARARTDPYVAAAADSLTAAFDRISDEEYQHFVEHVLSSEAGHAFIVDMENAYYAAVPEHLRHPCTLERGSSGYYEIVGELESIATKARVQSCDV